MKKLLALLFFVTAFAAVANAQSICGLIPGPCMERFARQGYAPVDYMLNNYGYGYGYGGYGYYGGRLGTSALVGAATGAIAGGLVAAVVSHRSNNRVAYATAPNGGQYYAEPRQVVFAASKPQKALDCRKPAGKRGKNEAACEAAEQEMKAANDEAKHQACLDNLAASSWRLRNDSAVWPAAVTINGQPLVICGEQVVVHPRQTIRTFQPEGQVGGKFVGADEHSRAREFEAKVRPINEPGFVGFVLQGPCRTARCEGGN